jgi:glutamine cyclotransferase
VKRYNRGPAALLLPLILLLAFGCAPTPQAASIGAGADQPTRRTALPLSPPTAAPAAEPQPAQAPPAPIFSSRVVASYPHDAGAFTQGLVYIGDDSFYEGTGLNGASTLREVALADGAVRRSVSLSQEYFGEGIAVVGDYIFQITWQNGVGFIYDRASFERVGEFRYPPEGRELPAEGWGLTYDGQRLIMSDGTANLYFIDPEATRSSGVLAITGQITVQAGGQPVPRLNELEFVDGAVLANIWYADQIARIDPASGEVTGWFDLSGLLPNRDPNNVLNGIAYDEANDRLFVTGKNWPQLFEIDLIGPISLYAPLLAAG